MSRGESRVNSESFETNLKSLLNSKQKPEGKSDRSHFPAENKADNRGSVGKFNADRERGKDDQGDIERSHGGSWVKRAIRDKSIAVGKQNHIIKQTKREI